MNSEIIHTILLGSCFLLLFTIAEVLYYKKILIAEHSRKLVHIVTGTLTLLFPIYLKSIWSVGFLCSSFLLILLLSKKYNFLKGINQIERKSAGSILYPIIVFICFCVYKYSETRIASQHHLILFYLPILILAISDPVAALVGKRFGKTKIPFYDHKKSWMGSFGFFISAFLIAFITLNAVHNKQAFIIGFAFTIAVSGALIELVSINGWDNFTIPIIVLLNTYCFISYAY
jgi:phytol kinase